MIIRQIYDKKARGSQEPRAGLINPIGLFRSEPDADPAIEETTRDPVLREEAVPESGPRNRRLLVEQVLDTQRKGRIPRVDRVGGLYVVIDRGTEVIGRIARGILRTRLHIRTPWIVLRRRCSIVPQR